MDLIDMHKPSKCLDTYSKVQHKGQQKGLSAFKVFSFLLCSYHVPLGTSAKYNMF